MINRIVCYLIFAIETANLSDKKKAYFFMADLG